MSAPYEEIIDGLPIVRMAPPGRHEQICRRLHARVAHCLAGSGVARLLPPRTRIELGPGVCLCPDLALVAAAHGKPWLVAEIISNQDHEPDTVLKKALYDDHRLPRLWMIDPRYDNVEVYHGTGFGLMLKGILAGREILTERLLPNFAVVTAELFA